MPIDPAWEKVFRARDWGQSPNPHVVNALVEAFYWADRGQVKILDLGCGCGANTWYCAAEGFNTYAIDGSRAALEKTQKLLQSLNLTAELRHGDLAKLPYIDGLFDMVIDVCSVSCSDLTNSVKIYREVARVLKPGGILYVQAFAPGTDPACFAEDTFNRIASYAEMFDLLEHDFGLYSYDLTQRRSFCPSADREVTIVEWKLGLKKK